MRYLGLDLGTKTLGVSVSDSLGLIARALKVIRFDLEDYNEAADKLSDIIEEYKIKIIVLGYPKNMDNTIGFAAKRSLNFKSILEEKYEVKVELEDERLSSVEANNVMLMHDISREKRKKSVDAVASTIILQRYLDRKGK